MPNWCWNHLTVTGDKKELQQFVEKSTNAHEDKEFSFEGTLPRGDRKDWYDWSIGNWGTKWDACEPHIENNDKEYFAVTFDSAWSPPIEWLKNIVHMFPKLYFTLEYDECGMCFAGIFEIQHNEVYEDQCWDTESASECCNAEIDWDHPEYDYCCTMCGCETETVSVKKDEIKKNLNYKYKYEK
jgi:hypothetical protein